MTQMKDIEFSSVIEHLKHKALDPVLEENKL